MSCSLHLDAKNNAAATAAALALEFGCSLPHAKRALWDALCRYVQPEGMTGDVLISAISSADVDAVFLDLRSEWQKTPPPKAVPDAPQVLSAPTPCRTCKAQIRWGTLGSKRHPYDLGGGSHFDTCPDRDRWRRKQKDTQHG